MRARCFNRGAILARSTYSISFLLILLLFFFAIFITTLRLLLLIIHLLLSHFFCLFIFLIVHNFLSLSYGIFLLILHILDLLGCLLGNERSLELFLMLRLNDRSTRVTHHDRGLYLRFFIRDYLLLR